jgi:nucleotide-binding universal stress UspA family protein
MICDVLAVVDSSPGSRRVLDAAVDLARAERARLTLMLPVAPPAWCTCFSPVSPGQVLAEVQGASAVVLRRLADECAADVPITTLMPVGRLEAAVLHELARRRHDVVVVAETRRRRLRRDPVARLARRCPVPLLTVPLAAGGAPRTVELGPRSARPVDLGFPANPANPS